MHLGTFYNGVELQRRDKALIARFLEPHSVIATCRANGGIQRNLSYVLNHQGCESRGHTRCVNYRDIKAYHASICEPLGLPPEECAVMGTAANMHHAAIVRESFRDLEVVAVITGGVEANAGRAGDPASVLELPDGFESLKGKEKPGAGTINTLLFISRPLLEGALTRVIMTAAEAKTAALQELNVNSRYSDQPATGTGTDQIIVSAAERDEYHLSWAGKHSKLGELIGVTVHDAVKETLARQNRLTPGGQCSVKIHLERFGCNTADMLAGIRAHLNAEQQNMLNNNFHAVNRDPLVVAGAASMAHLLDKCRWQVLPATCMAEILGATAAQMACAVSGKYGAFAQYRLQLGKMAAALESNGHFLELCWKALALGFAEKWSMD